jgi:hypothetical protein
MPAALKSMITGLASVIEPTDDLGREHIRNALSWLAGTDDIFRRVKPLTRHRIWCPASRSSTGRRTRHDHALPSCA